METKFEIVKNAFDTKNFNTISFRSFAYKHAFGLLDFRKRGEFEMLKQKYIFDPSTVKGDLDIINPLSLEPQNPWNIQQEYEDLRNTIKMDVDRIFPDIPKFQDPVVKEIIGNVLFVWALENSTISYRQGMHEIGSIVFLVIERDMISPSNHTHKSNSHQDFNHVANNVELQREMVVNICDTRYLEHDTYILFSALMEKMGVLYEKAVDGQESAIILRCRLFFNDYLKTVDYELYRYMMLLNIEPQLFGMRWLRLLFAREVDLEKVLKIWDALIFRSSSDSLSVLDTIDWIAVSLLVSMRTKCKN